MAQSPSGTNQQHQAVFTLTERRRDVEREADPWPNPHLAGLYVGGCMSVCVCLCDLFLSSFLCPFLCQSWNFMAGDHQRWFWVQSWIIPFFSVWYKHLGTYVCSWKCAFHLFGHPADLSLEKFLSGVCSHSSISAIIKESALPNRAIRKKCLLRSLASTKRDELMVS